MLGLDGDPQLGPDKKLLPLEAWGVKVMSIGFLVDEGAPMIWRGPMASSALNQLLNDVAWGTEPPSRWTCWSSTCRRAPATSS